MTRKLPALFTFSLAFSFIILSGIFGREGFLRNRALEREVAKTSYEKDVLALQVDSLREREKELREGSGLNDAALKLGYRSEGERVYYFADDQSAQENQDVSGQAIPQKEQTAKSFEGLPVWIIFLISLAISAGFTVFWQLRSRVGERNRHARQ